MGLFCLRAGTGVQYISTETVVSVANVLFNCSEQHKMKYQHFLPLAFFLSVVISEVKSLFYTHDNFQYHYCKIHFLWFYYQYIIWNNHSWRDVRSIYLTYNIALFYIRYAHKQLELRRFYSLKSVMLFIWDMFSYPHCMKGGQVSM